MDPKSRKIPKSVNLQVVYTNINAPIKNKIKRLVDHYPDAKIFIISEVETNVKAIESRDVIELGLVPFYHQPMHITHRGKEMDMICSE